jgi:biotin carboxyl carrier protein
MAFDRSRRSRGRVELDHGRPDRATDIASVFDPPFRLRTPAREHRVSVEHEGHFRRADARAQCSTCGVQAGQRRREKGAVLLVLEAMKMELSLTAPWGCECRRKSRCSRGKESEEGDGLGSG